MQFPPTVFPVIKNFLVCYLIVFSLLYKIVKIGINISTL